MVTKKQKKAKTTGEEDEEKDARKTKVSTILKDPDGPEGPCFGAKVWTRD
jgi:hypothetical protein